MTKPSPKPEPKPKPKPKSWSRSRPAEILPDPARKGGRGVSLRFDPYDLSQIQVWY